MIINLMKGQPIPVTLEASWLFVESIDGKLTVEIDETGERVTLLNRSVFRYGKKLGRILLSGEGQLSLEHGVGDFTAPIEGQKLDIQTMPKMQIDDGQNIEVSALPAVEIAQGQEVIVSALPKVQIENNQSLAVDSLPPVEIKAGQSLAVSALPKVVLEVSGNLNAHIGEVPLSVPANAMRKGVWIKAKSTNTGLVDLMGFELAAGEQIRLESTALIELTGTAPDAVQVLEY
ncbi:hypothetical protein [Vibrio methylphosphonaticus]|uniref:hypothetical protein n=1 Tax=Vibrio methylphosphonaticus TaxID=2946866 RepID=UPI00202A36B0|nr:hypothetical protein [Vibrio methylphosphonaticus]MCL9777053.1 hypothetical protein [Vibrio methylphosphonaticus]